MTHYFISRRISVLCLAIFALFFAGSAFAQTDATHGKDFYLTFFPNPTGTGEGLLKIRYVVPEGCRITAQYGNGAYLDNNKWYDAGVYTVDVNRSLCAQGFVSGTKSQKMLKVMADKDIGLFAINVIDGLLRRYHRAADHRPGARLYGSVAPTDIRPVGRRLLVHQRYRYGQAHYRHHPQAQRHAGGRKH